MPSFNARLLGLGRWLSQWGAGCLSMEIWVQVPTTHVESQAHPYEAVFLELWKQSQEESWASKVSLLSGLQILWENLIQKLSWEVTRYQPLTYTADTHAHSSAHMCVQTSAHTCAGAHTHTKLKITKLSEISSSYLGKSLVSTVVLKNVFEFIL